MIRLNIVEVDRSDKYRYHPVKIFGLRIGAFPARTLDIYRKRELEVREGLAYRQSKSGIPLATGQAILS